MKSLKVHFLSVSLMLLSIITSYSQKRSETIPFGDYVPKGVIKIKNQNDQPLAFHLSFDSGSTWEAINIKAGSSLEYLVKRVSLRIKTGEKVIEYPLEENNCYVIRWNSNENIWDIFNFKPNSK